MNVKGTLITLAIFVVLLGVYLWDKHRREAAQTAEDLAGQLMAFEAEDLEWLTLNLHDEVIELRKIEAPEGEDARWEIVRPVHTDADAAQVQQVIASLAGARRGNPFELGPEQALSDYGLDNPGISVEMRAGEGDPSATLAIGERSTGNGDYFAMLESEADTVFLLSPSVRRTLDKTLYTLREKSVIAAPPDEVTTMTLAMDLGGQMVAAKSGGHWALLSPYEDAADEEAIGDLLRRVNGARAQDFVDTTGTLNLAEYGLDNPLARLTVEGPEFDEPHSLLIGNAQPDSADYYAKRQDSDQVLVIAGIIQEDLTRSFEEYRAKELFPHAGIDARRMEVNVFRDEYAEPGQYTLVREEQGMWVAEGEEAPRLDQAVVSDMLEALLSMRVQEFHTGDGAATNTLDFGLAEPLMSVTLQGPEGAMPDSATIGRIDMDTLNIYGRRSSTESSLVIEWKNPQLFVKSLDDLKLKRVTNFRPEEATAFDIIRAEGGEERQYHFEQEDGRWRARLGDEGEMEFVPEMEAMSFLYALDTLPYDEEYDADAQDLEFLASPADIETTFTLKSAAGETLLDVGVTGEQLDQRFLKRRDGGAWSVSALRYEIVEDATAALLNVAPSE